MSKLKSAGDSTGEVEVTSISRHGFWLYLGGRELFIDFREFPWFAGAAVSKVLTGHSHRQQLMLIQTWKEDNCVLQR